MTQPHDPRTPQERAYALDESQNGTAPESQDAAPHDESQQDRAPENAAHDDTRVLHTDDPTAAYGTPVTNPTLVYPEPGPYAETAQAYQPTQGYPPMQGYQPTQSYPPVQSYPPGHGYPPSQPYQPTQAFAQPQHQPPGGYPPNVSPPDGPYAPAEPPKSPRGPRWGLLLLAAAVLIVLGGTAGFLLSRSETSDSATGTRPFTTPAPTAPVSPGPSPEAMPSQPLDELPGGLGEIIGDSGAVVGTVTANDGGSITISGIGGSLVTVLLTPDTEIITLSGDDPSALVVGSAVIATGTPVESGRMTADTVVSASIPSFDGPGR